MLKLIFTSIALSLFLLTACVGSLEPYYTPDSLTFDEGLLGTWTEKAKNEATYVMTKKEAKSYILEITDKGKTVVFQARLFTINGKTYLDIYPERSTNDLDLYQLHMVSLHSCVRIEAGKDSVKLWAVDLDWMEKYLKKNPDVISHSFTETAIVFTAPTAKLREFISALGTEGFASQIEFVRVEDKKDIKAKEAPKDKKEK